MPKLAQSACGGFLPMTAPPYMQQEAEVASQNVAGERRPAYSCQPEAIPAK